MLAILHLLVMFVADIFKSRLALSMPSAGRSKMRA
jgi:hypothetical protein